MSIFAPSIATHLTPSIINNSSATDVSSIHPSPTIHESIVESTNDITLIKQKTRRGKRAGTKSHQAFTPNTNSSDATAHTNSLNSTVITSTSLEPTENKPMKRKRGNRKIKLLNEDTKSSSTEIQTKTQNGQEYLNDNNADTSELYSQSSLLPVLQSDIKSYLLSIERKLKQDTFEDDQDKQIFINNVYKEVSSHELSIAGDPDGSRILEVLLLVSNDFHIRVFFCAICEVFEVMMCHQFASHVCQTLLLISAEQSHREVMKESLIDTQDPIKTVVQLVTETCDVLSTYIPFILIIIITRINSFLSSFYLNFHIT